MRVYWSAHESAVLHPLLLMDSYKCPCFSLPFSASSLPLSLSSDRLYYMEVYLKNVGANGFVDVKVRVASCLDLLWEVGPLECVL